MPLLHSYLLFDHKVKSAILTP